jgi:beta-mannosidase
MLSQPTIDVATGAVSVPLHAWECCSTPPGAVAHPKQLGEDRDWMPATVPGTVASALQGDGRWALGQPLDADDKDWWFHTQFRKTAALANRPLFLHFDGLATLAEVWLNGEPLFDSTNMFRTHRIDVSSRLQATNDLTIAFRSLTADLECKRPRPRWKTKLVDRQQLRWRRTSLLGRMPGWSPPVPSVGPWRPVRLVSSPVTIERLVSHVEDGIGHVTLTARLHSEVERVWFRVGEHEVEARPAIDGLFQVAIEVPNPPPWWPHTHGAQTLLDCSMTLENDGVRTTVPCGRVGFRSIHVASPETFALEINGTPVYCRGACWTVSDIVRMGGDEATLRHDLELLRDAGANMVRVGGTMVYESDRFYEMCDELGLLVWQDFMFANMDYPVDDPKFAAEIHAEATDVLRRLTPHPCVAVYCGNSEVEQQAAMLGMPPELWRNRWFAEDLPALCDREHFGVPYVPSSPSGGTLPFHVRTGVAHYYGVGAYRRSIHELRRDDVKFASECLAFANVPCPATVNAVLDDVGLALHHPRWKERVPRDNGAAWDFDDVRDHYLRELYGVDPVSLRMTDPDRYLRLSRLVSGEMLAKVFGEWRSGNSSNRGGLVWFYKDLWPGAGWGIIDSLGFPKAAYYYLRRAWQTRQLTITDEGLDGLHVHVINETADVLSGSVEVALLKDHRVITRTNLPLSVTPRSTRRLEADRLLGRFHDVNYAYRFGPPPHDIVVATLLDHERRVVSEAYYFIGASEPAMLANADVRAVAVRVDGDRYELTLRSDRFLHGVTLDVAGYLPEDDSFHLPPEREKIVRLVPFRNEGKKLRGHVEAINLPEPIRIETRDA